MEVKVVAFLGAWNAILRPLVSLAGHCLTPLVEILLQILFLTKNIEAAISPCHMVQELSDNEFLGWQNFSRLDDLDSYFLILTHERSTVCTFINYL